MSEEIQKSDARHEEDIRLIEAYLTNDEHAFDKLVVKYKDKVFNLCYRFMGDYEDANDCAQETFIKACRSLKRFRGEATFSTWLYRIAVNTCKNARSTLESRRRKKTVRLDAKRNSQDCAYTIEIADTSQSPTAQIERKEMQIAIQQAIDALPKDQKTVVVLRDIENLSYEEIVKITGYPLGTVKSKLSRAREVLRKKLQGLI